MIAKIPPYVHSSRIHKLVYYLMCKSDGAYQLGYLQAESPAEIVSAFQADVTRNPRVEKPIMHLVISISPEDRPLGDAEWEQVARLLLHNLGYQHNLMWMVRHTNEPHPHIHLLVSRLRADTGKVVDNSFEHTRATLICRSLEAQYGLTRLRAPGRGDAVPYGHPERKSWVKELRWIVDLSITNARDSTVSAFLQNLHALGVSARLRKSGGEIQGIVFGIGGREISGAKLKRSWPYLIRALDFDPGRDLPAFDRVDTLVSLSPSSRATVARMAREQAELGASRAPSLISLIYGNPGSRLASRLKNPITDPKGPERDREEHQEHRDAPKTTRLRRWR